MERDMKQIITHLGEGKLAGASPYSDPGKMSRTESKSLCLGPDGGLIDYVLTARLSSQGLAEFRERLGTQTQYLNDPIEHFCKLKDGTGGEKPIMHFGFSNLQRSFPMSPSEMERFLQDNGMDTTETMRTQMVFGITYLAYRNSPYRRGEDE